jgi:hypothetical protein
LIAAIDAVPQENSELYRWCIARKREKARWAAIQGWLETGLPFARALWPLEMPAGAVASQDANYNFPRPVEEAHELGVRPTYQLMALDRGAPVARSSGEMVAAADLCDRYLSHLSHHVVAGEQRAGKTWLRLYLEHYAALTVEKVLPTFFFAHASLASPLQADRFKLVHSLASSLANQLFASLLVRSGARTASNDPLRASRNAMTEFLAWYEYNVPAGNWSLAQPFPEEQALNIDQAYGSGYLSEVYSEMRQAIDRIVASATPLRPSSVEMMLDHIQLAVELAGYQSAFVFVDNWDNLPPLQRLLALLLEEDLLIQWRRRNIFFKIFVPALDRRMIPHVQPICEIERLHNGARRQLLFYSYP